MTKKILFTVCLFSIWFGAKAQLITNAIGIPYYTTNLYPGHYNGDGGPATAAGLFRPGGLAFDSLGNLYIADAGNSVIRKVTTDGIIHAFAGNRYDYPYDLDNGGSLNLPANSSNNASALNAELIFPSGVSYWHNALYYADPGYNVIRKITSGDTIILVAGNGADDGNEAGGYVNSSNPLSAFFYSPSNMMLDAKGEMFISDWQDGANIIRKIGSTGIVSTLAGSTMQTNGCCAPASYTAGGSPGNFNLANRSKFTVDEAGNVYFTMAYSTSSYWLF